MHTGKPPHAALAITDNRSQLGFAAILVFQKAADGLMMQHAVVEAKFSPKIKVGHCALHWIADQLV